MTSPKRAIAQGILLGAGILMVIGLFESLGWKMALGFLAMLTAIGAVCWALAFLVIDSIDRKKS